MAGRIVLFGATGYTGALTARALVRRGAKPVLAARSKERLALLAEELGGLETCVADVTRPETVRALVQGRDVLISTVGPFRRWGAPAIEAAIDAGAVYIDSTGEPAFIRRVFERYGPEAERTGASLLPAFGYDWVPGNLAGALALSEAGRQATRVQIAYFGQGEAGSSAGTRASVIGALFEPSFGFRAGRLRTERTGARVSKFDLDDSRGRFAISVGGSEHLTLPALYPQLQYVDVLLGMGGAHVRFMPLISGVAAGASKLPPARAALEGVLGRQAKGFTGPDEAARSRTRSAVLATACTADGRERSAVRLDGPNSYTFGFEMLAWAATAAAAGNVTSPGALGPVAAFGLRELEAGVRAAGISRAREAS
jgi:short subunit dehydrogenase-like uncharacterized protein